MLVVSRKDGEEIWLDGGRIRVRVIKRLGGRTRVGIEAPKGMRIARKELAHDLGWVAGDNIDPADDIKSET